MSSDYQSVKKSLRPKYRKKLQSLMKQAVNKGENTTIKLKAAIKRKKS